MAWKGEQGERVAGEQTKFKKPIIWTRLLQIGLVLQIAATAVVGAVIAYNVVTGDKVLFPAGVFEVYEIVRKSVAFWPLLNIIVTMFWIYNVNRNTHVLSEQKLEFSPGWAVGWFFVPVASLVQPYLVVSELYNANRQPDGWKQLKRPWITGIWWSTTVAGNILGTIISRLMEDTLGQSLELSLVVSVLIITHQVLGLVIFTRIGDWQMSANRSVTAESVF